MLRPTRLSTIAGRIETESQRSASSGLAGVRGRALLPFCNTGIHRASRDGSMPRETGYRTSTNSTSKLSSRPASGWLRSTVIESSPISETQAAIGSSSSVRTSRV